MNLAIMQPYFFPYIGYFQLVKSVDLFILYDDVNYIKQGWINRNRILVNGEVQYLTLQLLGASSFKKINQVETNFSVLKIEKTIEMAYLRAPFFDEIMPTISEVLRFENKNLAEFVSNSVARISSLLGIGTQFKVSSDLGIGENLKGQDRILEICRQMKARRYINPIGGVNLYSRDDFLQIGVDLAFINAGQIQYRQNIDTFYPNLSIVDVLMNCGQEKTSDLLGNYELK